MNLRYHSPLRYPGGKSNLSGFVKEIFRHNPYYLRGRSLYYASAIGTEPLFADVILDQVAAFDAVQATAQA